MELWYVNYFDKSKFIALQIYLCHSVKSMLRYPNYIHITVNSRKSTQ